MHLTRVAAADLERHHIRVNAVEPGFITPGIITASFDLAERKLAMADAASASVAAKAQPVARAGRPEDIAAAVAFLASEDAAFITGTHILVDGGMMIGTRSSWDETQPSLFAALDAIAG